MPNGPVPGPRPSSEVFDEITKRKLIVLWEIEPNSDRFQQIMLLPEGQMRVEAAVMGELMAIDKIPGAFAIVTNPKFAVRLPEVPAHYSPRQIFDQANKGPDRTRP